MSLRKLLPVNSDVCITLTEIYHEEKNKITVSFVPCKCVWQCGDDDVIIPGHIDVSFERNKI